MNHMPVGKPSSGRLRRSILKVAPALALLGMGLSIQPVRAADYKISWLDLGSVAYGANVANGTTFPLPGYAGGTVRVSYTSTSLNWIRSTSAQAQNGIITQGQDQYGWASVDYLTACNYDPPPGAIDYTLTFSFSGQPVPPMHLVLASVGLGGDTTDGPTIATVDTNGTFLGDYNIGTDFAPTICTQGTEKFSLTNSVTEPATGFFNTDFGVTLIDGAVSNNLTLHVHQVGYDGIGFTIGLLEAPCSNNCLAIYTPNDITVTTCSNGVPVFYSVNVSDACCNNCVTLVSDPPSGTNFSVGTTTVTSTATDTQGNSNSCTFTVTVIQLTNPPVVTFRPASILICGQNGCGLMPDATTEVRATTPGGGSVFVSQDIMPGTPVCGSNSVNFTVEDACGDATNFNVPCSVTNCANICLQVEPPSNIVVTACVPAQVFYEPTVTDNCCSNLSITFSPTNGSFFSPGTTTTVQCNVTDSCGATNLSSFTVTVLQGTNPPVITFYPSNVFVCVISNGCGLMPNATSEIQATTPAGGGVFVSQNIAPGTPLCGNTNVTFSVMDVCGNTTNLTLPCYMTNCALCLTVQCTNIVKYLNDTSGTNMQVQVSYGAPMITDTCCASTNPPRLVFTPPSGSYFPAGSNTTVTCTVTDGCGDSNSCNFIVTVNLFSIVPASPDTNDNFRDFNINWVYPNVILHLQQSPDLQHWSTISNAVSPYTIDPAAAQRQFYRLSTN